MLRIYIKVVHTCTTAFNSNLTVFVCYIKFYNVASNSVVKQNISFSIQIILLASLEPAVNFMGHLQ
jgi:hypothetical protein